MILIIATHGLYALVDYVDRQSVQPKRHVQSRSHSAVGSSRCVILFLTDCETKRQMATKRERVFQQCKIDRCLEIEWGECPCKMVVFQRPLRLRLSSIEILLSFPQFLFSHVHLWLEAKHRFEHKNVIIYDQCNRHPINISLGELNKIESSPKHFRSPTAGEEGEIWRTRDIVMFPRASQLFSCFFWIRWDATACREESDLFLLSGWWPKCR